MLVGEDSQRKKGLLQPSAADDHIPKTFTERLHLGEAIIGRNLGKPECLDGVS
jgi:hypothetical protein